MIERKETWAEKNKRARQSPMGQRLAYKAKIKIIVTLMWFCPLFLAAIHFGPLFGEYEDIVLWLSAFVSYAAGVVAAERKVKEKFGDSGK